MSNAAEALRTSKGPVTVALDEGGLRCTWRDGAGAYLPFEAVTDATLDTTLFGTTMLVLTLASGGEVRVKIANGAPFDVLGEIVAHVGERRVVGAAAPPPTEPAFDRGDLELGPWLEAIRRHVCGRDAYRDVPPDRELFAALLEDERCSTALRAAAAHALLALGTEDDLERVALALVGRALPPLVLVAAGLGPGGAALVDDDLLAEMSALLSPRDRAAVAEATTERSEPAQAARAGTALLAATVAVSNEARDAAEARERSHVGASGRRALHPVSVADNGGRWVGRTYGF